MGRQRQGGARDKHLPANPPSVREALDATQQHTLPVLPAEASDMPAAPPAYATPTMTTSAARQSRRRAPRRTLGEATAVHAPVVATPSTLGALPDLDTAVVDAPEPRVAPGAVFSNGRRHQPDREQTPEDSLPTGQRSPALPVPAQESLPAAVAPETRDVAPAAVGQQVAVLIRGSGRGRHPAVGVVPRRHGPPSFMAQFFVGMVTVMLLVSVLTLASPLGRGTVLAGAFQGYANAVPWVPTPTPRPPTPTPYVPPHGVNPGQQAIINDIVAVFGSYAQGAINVARCESGFDPNARNPYAIGNSHAEGVFQILYPSTWSTTSYAGYSPYAYDANIRAAHQIFTRDGNSWREWACQP
jgi:hypothetical protein